jgi:hypothetical protein
MAKEEFWQASEARSNFASVMEGALSGVPQVIRHRSGAEVVVVARAVFENERPSLKDYLLTRGTAEEGRSLADFLESEG